jgi:methylthioribose-1-phosphate isomerase
MNVNGRPLRTISTAADGWTVEIIDQTRLPHELRILRIATLEEMATAIRTMQVRGAPLIGVAASYGLALGVRRDASDRAIETATAALCATRPTAVNLRARVGELREELLRLPSSRRLAFAYQFCARVADEEVEIGRRIGEHGLALIERAWATGNRQSRVNILTHCNAGWLATIDWGTALAPVYRAHQIGIPVHVWVDETRPRNQGYLTAWELAQQGVPHTIVVDNAGGHLMQQRQVDLCVVGTDRTTAAGDVCNKIGTYLKALAARDNSVPFYVALPSSSIDWSIKGGLEQIPIERRSESEVHEVAGRTPEGHALSLRVTPAESPAVNYGFDVTPAHLVSGLITERGVCEASAEGLLTLYPERRA